LFALKISKFLEKMLKIAKSKKLWGSLKTERSIFAKKQSQIFPSHIMGLPNKKYKKRGKKTSYTFCISRTLESWDLLVNCLFFPVYRISICCVLIARTKPEKTCALASASKRIRFHRFALIRSIQLVYIYIYIYIYIYLNVAANYLRFQFSFFCRLC
jgi:hypothetical protein